MIQEHKPKRWWNFSIRNLLILVTLSAFGVLAKQSRDHWQRLQQISTWVDACVVEAEPHGPIISFPLRAACPESIRPEQQLELLSYGAIHFEGAIQSAVPGESLAMDRRIICLKLLAELHAKDALEPLLKVATRSKDPEIQKLAVHLISLYRDPTAVRPLNPLLKSDHTNPKVRAAIVDLIGLLHASTYPIRADGPVNGFSLDCYPCINTGFILQCSINSEQQFLTTPGSIINSGGGGANAFVFPPDDALPRSYRLRLNEIMRNGKSKEERIAAARAIVAWPPEDYELRYAEWGVWLEVGGNLELCQSLLDEVPPFVHQSGNRLSSFKDRIDQPMVVYKPVVHLTANNAMAVDLEVTYLRGRPWYAYPKPDDFTLNVSANPGSELTIREFDNDSFGTLTDLQEGYPWLLPAHRKHAHATWGRVKEWSIMGLGLRWQSLIVSPQKRPWMNAPSTTGDPKYKWWKDLRDVDCSWVSSLDESEKFLFYDGPTLMNAPLKIELNESKLKVSSQGLYDKPVGIPSNRLLELLSAEPPGFREGFFIEISPEGILEGYILRLPNEKESAVDIEEINARSGDPLSAVQMRERIMDSLQSAGLRADEAKGLLDSWQTPFFESPGRRLIYLLQPLEYEMMIQMNCRPEPTEIARVGLVLREFE